MTDGGFAQGPGSQSSMVRMGGPEESERKEEFPLHSIRLQDDPEELAAGKAVMRLARPASERAPNESEKPLVPKVRVPAPA